MRAALLCLLTAACNPYDPDLGLAPFLCGTDEPRCPDGYRPVDVSPIRCECQLPGRADGGVYVCNGDPNEPNETVTTATPTVIGQNMAINYSNLAICPADEEDNYAMDVPQLGTIILVRVTFDRARSAPILDILNNSGASLRPALDSPEPGVVTAIITSMASGRHYARIRADDEVNYDLRLMITPPS